jgi:small subunit ribosomal protein S1
MNPPIEPDRVPTPKDEDEAQDAHAAAEFSAALNDFEHAQPEPAAKRPDRKVATPRVGQRVKGRIVAVNDDVMLIDVGGRSEAVADAREFREDSGALTVSVGDSIELHVAVAGEPLTLARTAKRQGGKVSLGALRQAKEAGLTVRGKVSAVNTGGLTVDVDGVRAFCPVSQIDDHFVEDTAAYVGRVFEFLVTEVDESRSRAVVSRRRLLQQQGEAKAREVLAALAPGQELEGTVTRMEPFGAFVDLGGVEGLVHVSEVSHARVAHPREAVSAGEKVRVRVLKLDTGKDGRPRVALSIKAIAPDPWDTMSQQFSRGARVSGVVVRLADFGAFVNIAPGLDGLVHVSQVSHTRIQHPREVLSPGQAVEVVVLAVEPERKRISLSIRDALEQPVEPSRMTRADRAPGERNPERGSGQRGGARGPSRGSDDRGAATGPSRPSPDRGTARGPSRPSSDRGPSRGGSRGGPRGESRGPRREERQAVESYESRPAKDEAPALTPMQLAFQRAREAQEKRERKP